MEVSTWVEHLKNVTAAEFAESNGMCSAWADDVFVQILRARSNPQIAQSISISLDVRCLVIPIQQWVEMFCSALASCNLILPGNFADQILETIEVRGTEQWLLERTKVRASLIDHSIFLRASTI